MMVFSINRDAEEKLIELVQGHRCLYEKSDIDYKNTLAKESKWREIGETLQNNCESLKKHWTKLRTQFMAFQRRLKNPSGSGIGNRPYFPYEKQVGFLKDVKHFEETISNMNINGGSDALANKENVDDLESVSDYFEEKDLEGLVDMNSTTPESSGSDGLFPRSKPTPKARPHVKGNKRKIDEFEKELLKVIKPNAEKDEFTLFTKLLAPKLRNIFSANRKVFLKLQQNMSTLVKEAELELLD